MVVTPAETSPDPVHKPHGDLHAEQPQQDSRRLFLLMMVLGVGGLVTVLDSGLVSVALATISEDLQMSVAQAQWVSTIYLLALAVAVPTTGWASARFGAKRLWLTALSIFAAGSVLCSLARTPDVLIASRALQAVGGGMVFPVGHAILVHEVPKEQLARYLGIVSMPMVLGPALGPIVGGVVVDHLPWPVVFLVSLPLTALVIAVGLRVITPRPRDPSTRLDIPGLLLFAPGISLLLYGLVAVDSHGGGTYGTAIVCLSTSAVILALFRRHAMRRRSEALIDPELFSTAYFRASASIALLFGAVVFGGVLVIPLYLQLVRDTSATVAALIMAPQTLGAVISMSISGRLTERIGARRAVVIGIVLTVIGNAMLVLAGTTMPFSALVVAQLARGLGLTMLMMPTYATAYSVVASRLVPGATSTINVVNRGGGALGTAASAVVIGIGIGIVLPTASTSGLAALTLLPPSALAGVRGELADVFRSAFALLLILNLLMLIPARWMPQRPGAPTIVNALPET